MLTVLAANYFKSFPNSLFILYSRSIELGCPVYSITPSLFTRQIKGIPLTAKDFIKVFYPSHPPRVRCYIFSHFLLFTLSIISFTFSSTLTPTILTSSPQLFFSSIYWLCCIGFWQGPHQVAQTSISKTWPYLAKSSVVPSEKTLLICPKFGSFKPGSNFLVILIWIEELVFSLAELKISVILLKFSSESSRLVYTFKYYLDLFLNPYSLLSKI